MTPSPSPRTCATCGFWSRWLPSCGDCLLHAYARRNAIIKGSADVPPGISAPMTAADETCSKWAPHAEVRAFAHGGAEPGAWKARAAEVPA